MGKLKSFSANSSRLSGIWGGGHTAATDPTKRGWACRRVKGLDVWMVGQKGVAGCVSLVDLGTAWDVAMYAETPAEALALIQSGTRPTARYSGVPKLTGFGLRVIALIEGARLAGL